MNSKSFQLTFWCVHHTVAYGFRRRMGDFIGAFLSFMKFNRPGPHALYKQLFRQLFVQ